MYRKILILFFFTLLLLTLPAKSFAHVLESDGAIGAVLHIDPDDDPIAGQPSGFFFEITDKLHKFHAQNCTCRVDVQENWITIYTTPVFQGSDPTLSSTSFFFTFPQRDVYQVKLIGAPKTPGSFQPFTITYNIRVARDSANTSSSTNFIANHAVQLGVGVGLAILCAFAILQKSLEKKRQKRVKKDEKIPHSTY